VKNKHTVLLAFAIIFAVVKFMDNPTDPTSLLEIGSRIVLCIDD